MNLWIQGYLDVYSETLSPRKNKNKGLGYMSVAELNSLGSTSNYWLKRNKVNLIRYEGRPSRLLVLLNTDVEHSIEKTFNNISCAVLGLHD